MENKKYAIRTFAPAADYGIGKWRTNSKEYAKRRASKFTKCEREHGFLMTHQAVCVVDESENRFFAV